MNDHDRLVVRWLEDLDSRLRLLEEIIFEMKTKEVQDGNN
jgi:hypothetical protein